jgi:hypothetical protein
MGQIDNVDLTERVRSTLEPVQIIIIFSRTKGLEIPHILRSSYRAF